MNFCSCCGVSCIVVLYNLIAYGVIVYLNSQTSIAVPQDVSIGILFLGTVLVLVTSWAVKGMFNTETAEIIY